MRPDPDRGGRAREPSSPVLDRCVRQARPRSARHRQPHAPHPPRRRAGAAQSADQSLRLGPPDRDGNDLRASDPVPAPRAWSAGAGRYAPRLARNRGASCRRATRSASSSSRATSRFSDGRPVTSSDVQFTLDARARSAQGATMDLRPMLDDVNTVELDQLAREVRHHGSSDRAGYVLRALAEIPIMPMHGLRGVSLLGGRRDRRFGSVQARLHQGRRRST